MWWVNITPTYEIPKGSGISAMFLSAIWMGGIDNIGQLKVAAQVYRNGNDYYTGPLTIDSSASVLPEVCIDYDKIFEIRKKEVMDFVDWWHHPGNYPEYQIPVSIKKWPAHGDITKKQAYYLAPFYDNNGDGKYNHINGDYPYFDLKNELCKSMDPGMGNTGILADQILKGDQCLWWVFNDKGNTHTESGGNPLGFEIRAQAFAYATNDELNNATFYTYEIINRSSFDLHDFYFGFFADCNLGYYGDDYIGCDVSRGLGYCYNGKEIDGYNLPEHYGVNPPADGFDFFNGLYMDADGLDNPKYDISGNQLCNESINGSNFGDGIADNERLGMQYFMFLGKGQWPHGIPNSAPRFYKNLKAIWQDGTHLMYGGNGHPASGTYGPACNFTFPGGSDPCLWGTGEVPINGPEWWTEESSNNFPGDRNFLISQGPVSIKSGGVNYVTMGVPWARALSGGPVASLEALRIADDKIQSLFDNCFKIVEGPDVPELIVQELDKEIILYLANRKSSNNYKEKYVQLDYTIPPLNPDTIVPRYDSLYHFEGYQIFQVKDATVGINDIHDPDMARIIAQCDIRNFDKDGNPISSLVNYYYSEQLNANVPIEEVNGENAGIRHSFRVKEDMFAEGDRTLVNHKKYYFLAIAYAYNNYKTYSQDIGNLEGLYGQKEPYKCSRKTVYGGSIFPVSAIPHSPVPENGGTVINASYGFSPKITRLEGQGNGGNELEFTQQTINAILSSPYHKVDFPEYTAGKGPLNIKIVDPLNVKPDKYILKFTNVVLANPPLDQSKIIADARWVLINKSEGALFHSDTSISIGNEQLFIDDGFGFSINIEQAKYPGDSLSETNGAITNASKIIFADSSKRWLTGVVDIDGESSQNWIRSGTTIDESDSTNNDYDLLGIDANDIALDPNEYYEKIINGTMAPYRLCSKYEHGPTWDSHISITFNKLSNLASVDLVITSDQSKWSRCAVIESCEDVILAEGNANKFDLRTAASVNVNGESGIVSNNPLLNSSYISQTGMGWFPGYAINLESGERLNIIFAEDSWLSGNNGRDMLWNPTSNYYTNLGEVIWGGKHFIYIMGHNNLMQINIDTIRDCPAYDAGKWIVNRLGSGNIINKNWVWANAMWTGIPMAVSGEEWMSTDVTIRLRVIKPYERYFSSLQTGPYQPQNDNFPMYSFSTYGISTIVNSITAAQSALDLIRIVPNPYFAYSAYETSGTDQRVKITNLPDQCTITIYDLHGTQIKEIKKDNNLLTSVDWNLKNHADIQIASGIYLFHIHTIGIGERIIKWFGILRPMEEGTF
ncbi:T9SS C-terminal target domain-containing protein [candidate division KSB1 bacterium]